MPQNDLVAFQTLAGGAPAEDPDNVTTFAGTWADALSLFFSAVPPRVIVARRGGESFAVVRGPALRVDPVVADGTDNRLEVFAFIPDEERVATLGPGLRWESAVPTLAYATAPYPCGWASARHGHNAVTGAPPLGFLFVNAEWRGTNALWQNMGTDDLQWVVTIDSGSARPGVRGAHAGCQNTPGTVPSTPELRTGGHVTATLVSAATGAARSLVVHRCTGDTLLAGGPGGWHYMAYGWVLPARALAEDGRPRATRRRRTAC